MVKCGVIILILALCNAEIIRTGDLSGELREPPRINLTDDITLHLYVARKSVSLTSLGDWAINITTRMYCYSLTNDSGFDDSNCGIPGPTLIMRPNTTAKIMVHNYLSGVGHLPDGIKTDTCRITDELTTWFYYKDADVHGLHVSPFVDDIVDEFINPFCPDYLLNETDILYNCSQDSYGDFGNYTFDILPIHYPGSHWYHAHVHGSVTLQVGGGLYGMINMLPRIDLEQYEPQIPNDRQHNIIVAWVWLHDNDVCYHKLANVRNDTSCLKHVNVNDSGYQFVDTRGFPPFNFPVQSLCYINCNTMAEYIGGGHQQLIKIYNYTMKDRLSDVYDVKINSPNVFLKSEFRGWLVNGMFQPRLDIKTGEWHRLRITAANMNYLLWTVYNDDTGELVGQDDLQVWLIANDGVYFKKGPRQVWLNPYNGTTVLPPGSRADLLIYGLKEGLYFVLASNDTHSNEFFSNAPVPNTQEIIMIINATGEEKTSEMNNAECSDWNTDELPCSPQDYSYSPYLHETRIGKLTDNLNSLCYSNEYSGDYLSTCSIALQKEGIFKSASSNSPAHSCQTSVNGIKYSHDIPLSVIPSNATHEWIVTSNFHPFHHHTFPFQLQREVSNGWIAQEGDWRDTVGAAGSFTMRVNYYDYTSGKLVVHCHFVPHEDHGMMAYYELENYNSFMNNYTPMEPKIDASEGNYTNDTSGIIERCDQTRSRLGFTIINSIDVDTRFILFVNLFGWNGKCYLGILGINSLRPGGVDNAWFGIGLGGSYQDQAEPEAVMQGHGVIWTMQTLSDEPLDKLNVKEVSIHPNYTFTDLGFTHVLCNNKTFLNTTSNSNETRQLAYYYCVRPLTDDFIHKINSSTNGFIWAYGEGRFQQNRIHYARGVCQIRLYDYDNNNINSLDNIVDNGNFNYTYCLHKQNRIGQQGRTQTNTGIIDSALGNSLFDITGEEFFRLSGFGIPEVDTSPPTNEPSITPTTGSEDSKAGEYKKLTFCIFVIVINVLFFL